MATYVEDTASYYHGDHLGSSRIMTGPSGTAIWQTTYTPFGSETATVSAPSHYKFTGKERDAESGNDYFGARYYVSAHGRWLTPDSNASLARTPWKKQGAARPSAARFSSSFSV